MSSLASFFMENVLSSGYSCTNLPIHIDDTYMGSRTSWTSRQSVPGFLQTLYFAVSD